MGRGAAVPAGGARRSNALRRVGDGTIGLSRLDIEEEPLLHLTLEDAGRVVGNCPRCRFAAEGVKAAWKDVVEVALPSGPSGLSAGARPGLALSIGRQETAEQVSHWSVHSGERQGETVSPRWKPSLFQARNA
jgi:hypothetical protein